MRDLLWLIRKTFLSTFRKKSSVIVFFILPIAGVLMSTFVNSSNDNSTLRIGVVNQDGQQIVATNTVEYLKQLNQTEITLTDEATMQEDIAAGKLDSGLIIKEGYSSSIQEGNPLPLQLVSVKGASVTSYVNAMLNNYVGNLAAIGKGAQGDTTQFQNVYNAYQAGSFAFHKESLKDQSQPGQITYLSVGYLLMFMLFSAFNLCEIILLEKENRTYLRLLSSPISARTYVLSNVVINMVILLLQIIVTLFFMKSIMNIDAGISYVTLTFVMFLFALCAISLSMMIISFANSSKSAGALQNLIIVPTCLLGGCFFPISIMPDSVSKFANFLPQYWVQVIVAKLQQGKSLGQLTLELSILVAFAAAFAVITIFRFSRNNDVKRFV